MEAFNQEYQSRRGSSDTDENDTSPAKKQKYNVFIVNNPPNIETIPAHAASKELLEKLETLAEKNAGESLGSINASVLIQPPISNMVNPKGAEEQPALENVHGDKEQPAPDLVQPAQPGPRRSSRIRKPKFEINPEPKKVRPIAPKPVNTTETFVETSKKSLKFSKAVVESTQDTKKATTAIPKSTKKTVGKRGSKLSLVKKTANDLEYDAEHHLKRRLLAAFRYLV